MTYQIIQPPFTLKFHEMSKKDLKDYFSWFVESMPTRISELIRAVRDSPGNDGWQPDFSPESLVALGEWFASQVERRPRTANEMQEIDTRSKSHQIPESGMELTNRTFSIAIDVSMYLSEVLLRRFASVHWEHPLANKRFIDYGQPVLGGFGPVLRLNPVRTMVSMAYGVSAQQYTGRRLREIFDHMAKRVQS